MGEMTPDNPVAVGVVFLNALTDLNGPDVRRLRDLVTPESLSAWGDFDEAAEMLSGCGMTTRADRADLDQAVAYVKYVSDKGANYVAQSEMVIMARAIGTLVHRPELGGWRVHALGDYVSPEKVPH